MAQKTLRPGEKEAFNANRDPMTDEPGAHPVGAGVGAAAGTAVGVAVGTATAIATGAAVGAVAGPVGAAIGAALGGVAGGVGGGIAGKQIAEAIDPTAEEAYWHENFRLRTYANKASFETYRPAYRYGVDSYVQNEGRSFEEVEADLDRNWKSARGTSTLDWEKAKPAARDAYDRLCQLKGQH